MVPALKKAFYSAVTDVNKMLSGWILVQMLCSCFLEAPFGFLQENLKACLKKKHLSPAIGRQGKRPAKGRIARRLFGNQ